MVGSSSFPSTEPSFNLSLILMATTQQAHTIQFYSTQDDSSYHLKNESGETQRSHVIDDLCDGLLLQSNILGVIHGKMSPDGDYATLVVISFEFHGQDQKRRFQQAEIKVRFADEKRPLQSDPEVYSLWPEGDFSFSESEAAVSQTVGTAVNAGGQAPGATLGVTGNWSRTTDTKRTNHASLKGARRIEGREWGKKNVVRLIAYENEEQKTGIPSFISSAILLKRTNKDQRFTAHVEVKGKAGWRYEAAKALRGVMGNTPETDPVIFDPSLTPSLSLKEGESSDALESVNLERLAEIVSTTMVSTVKGRPE